MYLQIKVDVGQVVGGLAGVDGGAGGEGQGQGGVLLLVRRQSVRPV